MLVLQMVNKLFVLIAGFSFLARSAMFVYKYLSRIEYNKLNITSAGNNNNIYGVCSLRLDLVFNVNRNRFFILPFIMPFDLVDKYLT